jgi:DNA invertase Pin-like site-specific DNA recombinase
VDSEWKDEKASAFSGSRGPGLRKATARCADLAATGEPTTLLVFDPDRLARGDAKQAKHLVEYWLDARKNGYELASVTTDLRELLMVALLGERAFLDSKAKSEHTKRGLRKVGESGRWRGGQPPLGYRIGADGHLAVVPNEARIVKRIYAEYVAGKGQNRIAAALNADGITTRRGAQFSPRVIIEVLQNRAYIGEIGSREQTLCADAHPPIIDRQVWERAQRLRVSRTDQPSGGRGRPAKRHLLAGLLRCPNGHLMLARRNGNGWEHYRCCDRHSGGTCPTPAVGRKKVDEMILSHFLNRHFDLDAERERLRAAAGEKSAEARDLAAQTDAEEQEAEAALVRIEGDYKRGALDVEDWQRFRAELTEEATASHNRAAQLRTRAAQIEAEAEQVDAEAELAVRLAAILKAAAGTMDDPEGVAQMRAALAATFERIVFEPGLPAWGSVLEGSPLLIGEMQLVPVLRPDLAPAKPRSHAVSGKASDGSACAAGSPPPS